MRVTASAEYSDLEDALVRLLQDALADIDVIAYPESDTMPGVKQSGVLIVGDGGDTVDDPPGRFMGGGAFAQSGTYSFNLDLYVKNLRGPNGIRAIVQQIRNAVNGMSVASPPDPLSQTRFIYRGSRPVKQVEKSNIWNYQIDIDANYRIFIR